MTERKFFHVLTVFGKFVNVNKSLKTIKVLPVNETEVHLQYGELQNVIRKSKWEAFQSDIAIITAETEDRLRELQIISTKLGMDVDGDMVDSDAYEALDSKAREALETSNKRIEILDKLMAS